MIQPQQDPIRIDTVITCAIDELYETSGTQRPSLSCPVVRLAELVGAFNLTCSELQGLTRFSAVQELARRGALMKEEESSAEPLAGFLYAVAEYGSIFVEQDDPVPRRRFSVAHELGHYVLHVRPLFSQAEHETDPFEVFESLPHEEAEGELDDLPHGQLFLPLSELQKQQLPPLAQMEREANRFAAELLMPSALVRELVVRAQRHFSDEDLIWRLATDLLVSRAAMRWKLCSLGLLPREAARWN